MRETYQKTFNFLKTSDTQKAEFSPVFKPDTEEQWNLPHIRVSAIYDKQSNTFIDFQKKIVPISKSSREFDKSIYIENLDEDFKYIKFELVKKDNGKSYITIFPQNMPFRVIYRGGGGETVEFPYTPVVVSLPIKGSGDFELTISTGVLSKEGEMKEDKQIKKLEFKQPEPIAIM